MVKVIMGLKGSGKTKQLIEIIHSAVEKEAGNVICIEKKPKLTYDIPHSVRLIRSEPYGFSGYEFFKGFLSGLCAGNYDITHIFVDNLYKIVGCDDMQETEAFLTWLDVFSEQENVKFTITISADTLTAGETLKAHF